VIPLVDLAFLVGSFLVLALLVYATRFGDVTGGSGRPETETTTCEICGEERVCEEAAGLTLCSACSEDLL
jgi:hypothetical protein